MKKGMKLGLLLAVVLLVCTALPGKAMAALVLSVRKGVTADIAFKNTPVPNAIWRSGNSKIVKIKSYTSKKVVYTGKKVGTTTLTAYNKKNLEQSYTITVNVFPSGKLNRMDFEVYGSAVTDLGYPSGVNLMDVTSKTYSVSWFTKNSTFDKNNPAAYFQTSRGAQMNDSFSQIKMLYGSKSLKKYKPSKDRVYKYFTKIRYKNSPAFKKKYLKKIKYTAEYKYGKKTIMRFCFDKKKKLMMIVYITNYKKVPIK